MSNPARAARIAAQNAQLEVDLSANRQALRLAVIEAHSLLDHETDFTPESLGRLQVLGGTIEQAAFTVQRLGAMVTFQRATQETP